MFVSIVIQCAVKSHTGLTTCFSNTKKLCNSFTLHLYLYVYAIYLHLDPLPFKYLFNAKVVPINKANRRQKQKQSQMNAHSSMFVQAKRVENYNKIGQLIIIILIYFPLSFDLTIFIFFAFVLIHFWTVLIHNYKVTDLCAHLLAITFAILTKSSLDFCAIMIRNCILMRSYEFYNVFNKSNFFQDVLLLFTFLIFFYSLNVKMLCVKIIVINTVILTSNELFLRVFFLCCRFDLV